MPSSRHRAPCHFHTFLFISLWATAPSTSEQEACSSEPRIDSEQDDVSLMQSPLKVGIASSSESTDHAVGSGALQAEPPTSAPIRDGQTPPLSKAVAQTPLQFAERSVAATRHVLSVGTKAMSWPSIGVLVFVAATVVCCLVTVSSSSRGDSTRRYISDPQGDFGNLKEEPLRGAYSANSTPGGLAAPPHMARFSPSCQPSVQDPGSPQVQAPNILAGSAAHHLAHAQATGLRAPLPASGAQQSPLPLSSSLGGGPVVESRFAVALSHLANAGPECTLDIVSLVGLPLLQLVITGGSKLDIKLPQQSSLPRVSVHAPKSSEAAFTIHDPHGRPFGKFQTQKPGLTEVQINGNQSMLVEGHSSNLAFSVTFPGGKPIALGRINKEDFKGDHFEVRALPGSDAVLVLAILLSLAVFTGNGV